MDLDEALLTSEESMEKAIGYLKHELDGVRTGRATTGLIEYVKVDYYGSPTDLRQIALITISDSTQLVVKPFDATSLQAIVKAIQTSGMGLNPMAEGKQIRINIPALSGERRNQFIGSVKQMGEQARVVIRNARRDGNKQLDGVSKDKSLHISEDDIKQAKDDMQELLKKYEQQVDQLVNGKIKDLQEV